ncbi:MAG: hypothetical protein ACOVLC_07115 [Flavobacterium sp.]
MMQKLSKSAALMFILFSQFVFSQSNSSSTEISEKLASYFALKREVISVHFNKSIYLSNEKFWFKGYVLNRTTQNLDQQTTNVYMQVFNENEELIDKQLIFCFGGSFSGQFTPDVALPTGVYSFRFFTNYMNNFEEDESSTYHLQVINPFTNDFVENKIQGQDIRISYFVEGGELIENTMGSITVEMKDCKGNVVRNQEVVLKNQYNIEIKKIKLNAYGLGRLEFVPKIGEVYTLKTVYNSQEFSQIVAGIRNLGISFSVNNVGIKNKCVVKLATNEASLSSLLGKKFFVVIHQDEKSVVFETSFEKEKVEKLLFVDNTKLFEGVNTVRLLDENLQELSSRLIFKYPNTISTSEGLIVEKNEKGKILRLKGINDSIVNNLSVSVLPLKSIAKSSQYSIKTDFLLQPYLIEKTEKIAELIEKEDRASATQLDLILSAVDNQKYKWNSILNKKVTEKHKEEIGLTIKGKVLNNIKDKRKHKVQAYSLMYNINDFAEIDENNQFEFKNFILSDSAYVSFNLVKEYVDTKILKATFSIEDNKGVFNKPFQTEKIDCKVPVKETPASVTNFKMPNIQDNSVIELENVDLVGKTTYQTLKYERNNGALRGYKVTDDDPMNQNNVLYYLERNGFMVVNNPARPVMVQARNSNALSINAAQSRILLIINDVQYRDFEILRSILIGDIDEIYTSTVYLQPGMNALVGKVVIYLKNGFAGNIKPKTTNTDFMVDKGFSPRLSFENTTYQSTDDDGFENFGVIHWESFIEKDESGYFTSFSSMGNEQFFIQAEGIDGDGKLISIRKVIE